MARNRKTRQQHKKQPPHRTQAQQDEDVVQDTTARLTCSAEAAADFADQCACALENLEFDLVLSHLAREIWHPPPEGVQPLLSLLQELLDERLRHRDALVNIQQQLQRLADDPEFHIHLNPPEAYRDLVRQRLFQDPPNRHVN